MLYCPGSGQYNRIYARLQLFEFDEVFIKILHNFNKSAITLKLQFLEFVVATFTNVNTNVSNKNKESTGIPIRFITLKPFFFFLLIKASLLMIEK